MKKKMKCQNCIRFYCTLLRVKLKIIRADIILASYNREIMGRAEACSGRGASSARRVHTDIYIYTYNSGCQEQ